MVRRAGARTANIYKKLSAKKFLAVRLRGSSKFRQLMKMHHVARMSKGGCGLEEGAVFTDLLNSFNRIASHCASAMVALLKGDEMDTDIHIHDSKIYPTDNWEYYSYLNEYNQKYDIKSKSESHIRSMEPEEVE